MLVVTSSVFISADPVNGMANRTVLVYGVGGHNSIFTREALMMLLSTRDECWKTFTKWTWKSLLYELDVSMHSSAFKISSNGI